MNPEEMARLLAGQPNMLSVPPPVMPGADIQAAKAELARKMSNPGQMHWAHLQTQIASDPILNGSAPFRTDWPRSR